jgi:RNA polymerase sigma-70 factor (ECF subfamily)
MRDEAASVTDDGANETDLDFADIWREWRPRAAAYCRAFTRLTAEDAQDLASEAVLRAWAARERYDPSKPFAPWFFTIVRRLAIDASSTRRETPVEPSIFDTASSSIGRAEDGLEREAEEEFTRRFVGELAMRDRELASLVYGQGLSVAEAARIVGLPTGSAKWRLFEIRKALRRAWEREYGDSRRL